LPAKLLIAIGDPLPN